MLIAGIILLVIGLALPSYMDHIWQPGWFGTPRTGGLRGVLNWVGDVFFFLILLSGVLKIPLSFLLIGAGLVLTVTEIVALLGFSPPLTLFSIGSTIVIWGLGTLFLMHQRTILVTLDETLLRTAPEWIRSLQGKPEQTRTLAVLRSFYAHRTVTALHWLSSLTVDQPEQLIVADSDSVPSIYLWTPQATGKVTVASTLHQAGLESLGLAYARITDLAVSPDHRYIATSDVKGYIRFFQRRFSSSTPSHGLLAQELINLSSDKADLKWRLHVLPPGDDTFMRVNSVSWAPSLPYRIAFGANDHTVKIWYIGTELFDMQGNTPQPIIDRLIAQQYQVLTYRAHQERVLALVWSQQGDQIVSASADGAIHLWNANSGDTQSMYTEHRDAVNDLAWSPDGEWIASACTDGSVHVWRALTAENRLIYSGHEGPVLAVAWSPDGKWIASAGQDKVVQVWETTSGHPRLTYRRQSKAIRALAWSSESQRLACGGEDGIVHVWEILG